jgi:hypothetical protein
VTNENSKKIISTTLAIIILSISFITLFFYSENKYPSGDPDRYYHFALSKITLEQGLIKALPQVEDLGWGNYFPDKEFLFRLQTTAGYYIAGEKGVWITIYIVAFLSFCLLLYSGVRLNGSWILSALLVVILAVWNPYYSPRMLMVRPHTLAVFFFILLLIGVIQRSRWLSFAAAFLFCLAYHAIYIPAVVLLAAAFFSTLYRDRIGQRAAVFGLCGLLSGILLNPYFPSNIAAAVEQLKIGYTFGGSDSRWIAGNELQRLSPSVFILLFFSQIFLCAFAASVLLSKSFKSDWRFKLFLFLALIFWTMTVKSPRASEYAIPVTFFLVSFALGISSLTFRLKFSALSVLLVIVAGVLWSDAKRGPDPRQGIFKDSIFAALKAIPSSRKSPKILNCDWYFGSFILYARNDARFVNILSPMRFTRPDLEEHIARMTNGEEDDLWSAAKNLGADYVLCDDPLLNKRLLLHPDFKLLFRPDSISLGPWGEFRSSVQLFEVSANPDPAFVRNFQLELSREVEIMDHRKQVPALGQSIDSLTAFLDFSSINLSSLGAAADDGSEKAFQCGRLSLPKAELARLKGAELISVGGMPHVRIWWNGVPLYVGQFSKSALFQEFVQLPRPLKSEDSLEVKVCRKSSPKWKLAIGLWTRAKLESLCFERRDSPLAKAAPPWLFSSESGGQCFAPTASRVFEN